MDSIAQIPPIVTLTVDDKEISVPAGTTVYHACKELGIEIPIFCYLDRLPPFGACRVCMVEVDKMDKPQTSCTLQVKEGMVVRTQSQMAEASRKQILEFLLLNHPLDCPICDRGGECPLQDNVLRYGPGMSRFFEEKRHFKKALPLGPLLMLDRERCISCARCTRFGEELAGDHALQFIERGYRTEVGTPGGAPADSKFIGNTIMICPVGALTSQAYRFRARPWDNDSTDSTCTLCPVGCSMTFDARDGQIMRTRSRENRAVNDIWMCDKGWFGYAFTSHPDRLKEPLIRRGSGLEPASWEEALSLIAAKIKEAKGKGKVAAFGGNPLTLEENFLFQQLVREGAGSPHLDHRIGMPMLTLDEEGIAPGMEMSIGECEELSFAALLGFDLTEEFPVIWLRLRQAINQGAQVVFMGHFAPEISRYLAETHLHPPGKEIEMLDQQLPHLAELAKGGKRGGLFVGGQYLANQLRSQILSRLALFQRTYPNVTLNIMEGKGNSMGARLAGMRPDCGPFGERVSSCGLNGCQVLQRAAQEGWDILYVAGANPALKFPSKLWVEARAKMGFLVVQDLFLTETAKEADVVLPTLTFIEKEGTFVNIEGRAQHLMPGKEVPDTLYADGEIFRRIADKLNLSLKPFLAEELCDGRFSIERSQKIEAGKQKDKITESGTLKATFSHVLFDRGVRIEHDSHLRGLVKGPALRLSSMEATRRRIEDGDSVEVSSEKGSFVAKVRVDDQIPDRTVVIPLGFEKELAAQQLSDSLLCGLEVEVEVKKSF